MSIQSIVQNFVAELQAEITNNLAAIFQAPPVNEHKGARITVPTSFFGTTARTTARKGPVQLCPVPGCKNRAAPVFGMVCAKHKDVPKAEIRAHREKRRLLKLPIHKRVAKPAAKSKAKPKAKKPAAKKSVKKGK